MSTPRLAQDFYTKQSQKLWRQLFYHQVNHKLTQQLSQRFSGASLTLRELPFGASGIVQTLEQGIGDVNCDFYPVLIERLPPFAPTPKEFLHSVRQKFNALLDTRISAFTGLSPQDDIRFLSRTPLGAVVHIDLRISGRIADALPDTLRPYLNPDDATVVVSQADETSFTFSTIWSPSNHAHPVSGHRQFGLIAHKLGYVFYTSGMDRTTRYLDNVLANASEALTDRNMVFGTADDLWQSLQQRVAADVNRQGGQASVQLPLVERHDWPQLKIQFAQLPNQVHRELFRRFKAKAAPQTVTETTDAPTTKPK